MALPVLLDLYELGFVLQSLNFVYVRILHRLVVKRSHRSALALCTGHHDGVFCSPRLVCEFVFSLCFGLAVDTPYRAVDPL